MPFAETGSGGNGDTVPATQHKLRGRLLFYRAFPRRPEPLVDVWPPRSTVTVVALRGGRARVDRTLQVMDCDAAVALLYGTRRNRCFRARRQRATLAAFPVSNIDTFCRK